MKSDLQTLYDGLETTHPEIDVNSWSFKFHADSYAGSGGYSYSKPMQDKSVFGFAARALGGVVLPGPYYLDRFPSERNDSFASRLNISTYVNFVKPIVDLYNDLLFRRRASRQAKTPILKKWLEDNSIEALSRKAMKVAQIYGTAFVLFDTENVQANNLLEALNNGFSGVYATVLEPSKILSWSVNDDGTFEFLKYRITDIVTVSPLEPASERVRWVVWTPAVWTIYEKVPDKTEARIVASGANPFHRVPVVALRYSESESGEYLGKSQIDALSDLSRAYYNRLSELTLLLRGQAFSQLILPQSPGGNENEVTVGPSSVILVDPASNIEPKYISPSASNSELYEERLTKIEDAIFRVAKLEYLRQQMTGRMQGNVSSGLSRQFSFAQCNAALVSMGKQLEKFEVQCLSIVGSYHKVESDYEVTYPSDYELNAGAADLSVLKEVIALGVPAIIKSKLIKSISANIVNLTGEELDQLDKEIEESIPKKSESGHIVELNYETENPV